MCNIDCSERKPIEIRSCWSASFRRRFLQGTTFSHWDTTLPWWALKTFERSSSILEIKFWRFSHRQVGSKFSGFHREDFSVHSSNSAYSPALWWTKQVSEKMVMRKSLAPEAEDKKEGSANKDAVETPRPPERSQLSTQNIFEVHGSYTLWKACRIRFCHSFSRELDY